MMCNTCFVVNIACTIIHNCYFKKRLSEDFGKTGVHHAVKVLRWESWQ